MSRHVHEELGAFVLDALETAEADHVRAHLAVCAECRADHERLAGLPALLDLVPSERPAAVAAPRAGMEEAVLAAVGRERGRVAPRARAWPGRSAIALAGAVAGAVATLVVLAIGGVLGSPASDVETVALSAPGSPASATAVLRPGPAGTRVDLRLDGLPPTAPGELYELWFVQADGGRVSAGTFTVPDSGDVRVSLTSAARPGRYERIGITREPDGVDPARNGPNIVAGRLPR